MQGREARPLPIDAQAGFERVEVCALSGERPGRDCTHRVHEWMTHASAAALGTCTMHTRVAIDRRNGLRAGPGCDPANVEMVSAEVLPPEYDVWADRAGRRRAPGDYSPACPAPASRALLRIDAPRDGDAFVLDPDRPADLQAIDLQVAAPAGARAVTLRVDGALAASLAPPFVYTWRLSRGDHVLLAEGDGAPSEPVHVRVE
jgi:penicillin-binding protein 1C